MKMHMQKRSSIAITVLCSLALLSSLTACGSESGGALEPAPSIDEPSLAPQDICDDCEGSSSGGSNPYARPDLKIDVIGDCPRNSSWQLIVKVKNRGPVPAAASTTRVTWYYGNSVDHMPYTDIPTAPLAAGQSVTYYRAIPESCFDPDCSFAITADIHRAVNESNETNNTKTGLCQR